ncbi:MAG: hypothetical protein AMJ75_00435 [Phycisphaerae bacterium SM1_79]|nr:MAG: hypothetical protein AMJ75_00435 [Phycisphaerae bacterium SM1_79]
MLTERENTTEIDKRVAKVLKAVLPKESSRYACNQVYAEQVHVYRYGRIRDASLLTVTDGRCLLSVEVQHNLADGLYNLKDNVLFRSADNGDIFPKYREIFPDHEEPQSVGYPFLRAVLTAIIRQQYFLNLWLYEKILKAIEKLDWFYQLAFAVDVEGKIATDRPVTLYGQNGRNQLKAVFMPYNKG